MKKIQVFMFLSIFMIPAFSGAVHRGRYLKGYTVYKYKLGRCAHLWWKFGDITKSKGKIIKSKTSLAQELGKLSDVMIRKWLADPMSVGPKVNCVIPSFRTETEIANLIYYLHRSAHNPPKKPKIIRVPFIRSKIRLVKTQKLLRERLKTLKAIRRWNLNDYTGTSGKLNKLKRSNGTSK